MVFYADILNAHYEKKNNLRENSKMKNATRKFSFLMALLLLLTSLGGVLTSCNFPTNNEETTTSDQTEDQPGDGNAITYKVHINTAGGMDLKGITVKIHTEENGYIVTDPIATDETGTSSFTLPRSNQYYVALSTVPEGYAYETRYDFNGSVCEITLTSSVIQEEVEYEDEMYKLGSVMHDFEFTDVDGNTYVLSEILEEKKCVLLNFWYTTCTYCIQEFPLLDDAYLNYCDDVEVLALNNYGDTKTEIREFQAQHELSLPMVYDETMLMYAFDYSAFSSIGYPISVVIDRYGVVCMIEVGAILDDSGFANVFKHFTAANYQQKLFTDPSELTPTEKPNVDMPSSEEINAAISADNFTATFLPETTEGVEEFCWPFVITEKNGETCIAASNSKKNYSYAALHATLNLKKGDAVAFDYFSSTEENSDVLYTRIDDVNICQISGVNDTWKTCYTFVAAEDGEYRLSFWYIKDSSTHTGDDSVYIKNLRIVPENKVDVPTYIPRFCATNPTASMDEYQSYSTIVYNETDGYYHIGTANGPLLLADLLNPTLFNNGAYTVYEYVQLGEFDTATSNALTSYANYSSNGTINGLCSVNQELKELLQKVSDTVGFSNDENAWLQICKYYEAYGTNGVQLEDPIKGLANHSAFTAVEGADNEVNYDGRLLMPRGFRYRFTPSKSGVYQILSNSEYAVEAWIFTDADISGPSYEYERLERTYEDTLNCKIIIYLEAGKNYYINIAFYDFYQAGKFTFTVDYLGETYQNFCYGSGGSFTSRDENDMSEYNLIPGGIEVALGADGFYHQLYKDGTLNPTILYADFTDYTPLFNQTLERMIDMGGFDFTYSDRDVFILDLIEKHGKGDAFQAALRQEWGDATIEDENGNVISLFDSYYELFKVDEVLQGIYHGSGDDKTEWVRAYMNANIILNNEEHPELNGCVPLTQELAEVLQLLLNKYTFKVDKSWTKVCCYYQQFGPDVPEA